MRFEKLNEYLRTLTSLNKDGDFDHEIQKTIQEINRELGVGSEKSLSSYSTKELHTELSKRTGVYESAVDMEGQVVITVIKGQEEKTRSYSGPVKILVNQD